MVSLGSRLTARNGAPLESRSRTGFDPFAKPSANDRYFSTPDGRSRPSRGGVKSLQKLAQPLRFVIFCEMSQNRNLAKKFLRGRAGN